METFPIYGDLIGGPDDGDSITFWCECADEKQFKELIKGSGPDAIVLADHKYRITDWNPATRHGTFHYT